MNKHLRSIRKDLEAIGDDLQDIVSHLAEDSASDLRECIDGWIAEGRRHSRRLVRAWLIRRYAGRVLAVGAGAVAVAAVALVLRDRH